jgi:hypothetical protein
MAPYGVDFIDIFGSRYRVYRQKYRQMATLLILLGFPALREIRGRLSIGGVKRKLDIPGV